MRGSAAAAPARSSSSIVGAARVAVGAVLAIESVLFALHGRGAFSRIGHSDAARLGLALIELAASVLFAVPATFLAGGMALLGVLAWAAGVHFALGFRAGPLYGWIGAVSLLIWLEMARRRIPRD